MKNYSLLFLSVVTAMCVFSCDNDEKITPPLDIPNVINNSSAKKVFSFDGMEVNAPNIKFDLLSSPNQKSGKIYEAEMEMTLPVSIRTSTTSQTLSPFKFKVNARSTEDRIVFNGDCLHGIGDVKFSVEGVYKQNDGWDSLFVNLKREAPQAAFAGKTFEMTLDERTFDYDELARNFNHTEWKEPFTLPHYTIEGMSMYMDYLRTATKEAAYRFTFQADGTLEIQKRNSENGNFAQLPGRFKYYLADKEIGFIEMDKKYATEIMKLLLANENASPYGFFTSTYLFEDVLNVPFCYKLYGNVLWLALGDKTGITNMNQILFDWRINATDYYNVEEYDPLGFVYMGWNKRENDTDQLWWRLEEQ